MWQLIQNIYIPILLLFVAMFSACVWQFIKIKKLSAQLDLFNLVNSASAGGYYVWYKSTGTEEISSTLFSMLRIPVGKNSFTLIRDAFGQNGFELAEGLENLKKRNIDCLRFSGEVTQQEEVRNIQCIGCKILDEESCELIGVVLWFFDISYYIRQINGLIFENARLNKEIKEYTNIFNTLPFPIWKRNNDFKINFCNFIYNKFVDSESEEPGSDIQELDQSLHRLSMIARDNGRALRMKKHLVIGGERRFYSITEMTIKNSGEVLGFAYDITDQDEIEKELARHISAHADLLESSSSAMAVYGADTKLRFYNNAFVNLWGLKVNWLDSKPTYGEILEVLREKRKLPEQADFKQFRKEQMMLFKDITKPHEEMVHLPDGKAIRIIAIPHALGGLLFAYEDVTDRLAMERSFNTLIAVQRETLDNLSEAVALFAENGKIRLYNPVFVKMWLEEEDYLEKQPRLSDLLERARKLYKFNGRWEKFKEGFIVSILGRKYATRREELTSGKVIDIISRPLPNGDTLVSFVDVTDSILAEKSLIERNAALEEADRLKTEFLANISYELRTPLTSIIGFSEALEAEYFGKLNPQQMDYVNGIHVSSSELLSLINDILDLSSIEAGYMLLDMKEFDIYKSLSSVFKILQERCKSNKQKLILKCDKKIGKLYADEIRIKHVIFKLLSNSMKFTKPSGQITLGAEPIGKSKVRIWIEDTGVGIEEKETKKVFERFFKAQSAEIMKKSGAGLGLAVVKSIVELHKGELVLASEVGKGTVISITLNRKAANT